MSRLCFFTNPWASGEIRGRQVADVVGGIVDPPEVYKDDVCVFVKCYPPDDLLRSVSKVYIDVIDSYGVIPWIRQRPNVGVIAISNIAQQYLSCQLKRDDIILIPEHHCNTERTTLSVKTPITVGYVGYIENLHIAPEQLSVALKTVGLDFVTKVKFSDRADVCRFYRTLDIQITFRKDVGGKHMVPELKNPLKLANAGSFGIPTVGYPELSYVNEFDGCFLPVECLDGIVYWCDQLVIKSGLYSDISAKVIARSENYHIDCVVGKYKELTGGHKCNM